MPRLRPGPDRRLAARLRGRRRAGAVPPAPGHRTPGRAGRRGTETGRMLTVRTESFTDSCLSRTSLAPATGIADLDVSNTPGVTPCTASRRTPPAAARPTRSPCRRRTSEPPGRPAGRRPPGPSPTRSTTAPRACRTGSRRRCSTRCRCAGSPTPTTTATATCAASSPNSTTCNGSASTACGCCPSTSHRSKTAATTFPSTRESCPTSGSWAISWISSKKHMRAVSASSRIW
ncbi:Uncharacterised protein [Mycobacterium tuberculosis]|nr:Uncharacterised protein [Mycobacterium tuberculosis]